MTRHHPDLGSASDWLNQISHAARPIRSTTQIWVMTHHQYGISAFVSQTSFGGETSGSVIKCRLFSQAIENSKRISSHPFSSLGAQNKDTSAASQTLLTVIRSRLRCRPHIVVRLGTNLDPSAYEVLTQSVSGGHAQKSSGVEIGPGTRYWREGAASRG